MNYLLSIDLETTGLDPNYHEIIQVAAILLDKNLKEIGQFSSLVRPEFPQRGINKGYNTYERSKINVIDLQKAPSLEQVIIGFHQWLQNMGVDLSTPGEIALLGQNIKFDYQFLEKAFAKCHLFFPFDYHAIDISSIYTALYIANEKELPEKVSLTNILTDLGLKNRQPHNAAEDARATTEAFKKLIEIVREVQKEKSPEST